MAELVRALLADGLVDRYYLLPGDEANLVLDVDSGDPGPDEGVDCGVR